MNLFNKILKSPFIFFIPKTSKNTKITKIFYLNKNLKEPFLMFVVPLELCVKCYAFVFKSEIDFVEPASARHTENKFSSALA